MIPRSSTSSAFFAELSSHSAGVPLGLIAAAAELARESIVITDADLEVPGPRIVYVNPAFTRMTGYSAQEVLGKNPRLMQGPKTDRALLDRLRAAIGRGEIFHAEGINYRKDGSEFVIDWQISPLRDSAGRVTHFIAFQRDVTQQRRAERELAESEARYRLLVEGSPDATFVHADDAIVYANPATARLLGADRPEDLIGLGVEQLVPEPMRDTVRERIAESFAGRASNQFWQHRLLRRDGTPVEVESVAIPIVFRGRPALQVLLHDLTERIRLEEQVQQAQRLESIGMLAAGIAHDLNNVLAPILMAAPMLRDTAIAPGDKSMLTAIENSATRGAALVRQILTFAHGIASEAQAVQLSHLMREIVSVVSRTFSKSIVVELELPRGLWPVRASATQVHQVLLNLCVNARDAMTRGGILRLAARNVPAGEALTDVPPGPWVELVVADTGTGIPPEVLARMWDPFFTTKTNGKGTGLGLATVRGIIDAHRGHIRVETAVSRGTTFRVYLPPAETAVTEEQSVSLPPRGNQEMVLLVDDDASVRLLTSAMLTHHGYRVMEACDGEAAMKTFRAEKANLRLVITDLDMPNSDGIALAANIRALATHLPILAMSGAEPGWAKRPAAQQPVDAFLLKPFTMERILGLVHSLVQAGARSH